MVVLDPRQNHDLEKLHTQGVRGIRLNLIGITPPDLGSRVWRELGKQMTELGWHLEVQAQRRQWDELADSLTRWSSAVVIDHPGLPARADFQAKKTVAALAALEHVWVKVSAPYRSEVPELALAQLLDTTGPARMLFGSDWPFTGHETDSSTGALEAWARKQLGEETFTATLPANAQRLLRWD
ncbi:amidohydrolase family protein [Rhodococcus globerulus]|uniref:Amidohydrolase family protein n=1 Tax=Rhodococcus globerulus TaxID=33008 RepID=A0ABU4C4Z3_RHOGO|nr:amidohydrolase family protein [Rhodococcus globerulus]MDV6271428.1 amidohydrolase family protein [Rhodococcus globerulus]